MNRRAYRYIALLLISMGICSASYVVMINLSHTPLDNPISAAWGFFEIVLIITSILVSPVMMVSSIVGLVSNILRKDSPKLKYKVHDIA